MNDAVKEVFRKKAEQNARKYAHRNATSCGDFSKDKEYYMTCPLEEIYSGDLDEDAERLAIHYGIKS